jgi:hypothetical protein
VVSVERAKGGGAERIVFRDSAAAEYSIALDIPWVTSPFVTGRRYEILVEYIGGAPAASGLVVADSLGLVLAGASDQGIGAHVLKGLPSGWEMALGPTDCKSRARSRCYKSITNAALEVNHEGRGVSLWNGQSLLLDGYRVVCLTAQRVEYEGGCADAGLHAVSWVILRDEGGESVPALRGSRSRGDR